MKIFLQRIFRYLLIFISVVLLLAASFFVYISDKYVVPIMVYHHIDRASADREFPSMNTVSADIFRKQMEYLKKSDYKVITLDELVSGIKLGESFSKKSVVITFDDGYEDNYIYAFPILKGLQLPATVFLISDTIGQKGYLNLQQIEEMRQHGISFGSHSRRHAFLPGVSKEQQINEIVESKRILEIKLKQPINYFTYPSGGFSDAIKDIVKSSGYKGACTTNRGNDRFNRDLFEIKRIRFSNKNVPNVNLWIKLSGYNDLFRRLRNPH